MKVKDKVIKRSKANRKDKIQLVKINIFKVRKLLGNMMKLKKIKESLLLNFKFLSTKEKI